MMRSIVIVAVLGCALAAAPTEDDALLHSRVGAGNGLEQTAFSSAVEQKNHGHSPHGHSPHGHSPHRHYPFGDSRRRRVPGGWSNWGGCNRNCGGGSRYRACNSPTAAWGGPQCSGSTRTSCNTHNCPRNGGWGGFGNWGGCSRSCAGGTKYRYRSCNNPTAAWGGSACRGSSSSSTSCNTQACPVDCVPGRWSPWSACTKSCGGGSKTMTRSLAQPRYGGKRCPARTTTTGCSDGPCPVHCAVSTWTGWTGCTKSCGTGSQSRSRTVTKSAQHGGYVCPFLAEKQACNRDSCPIDGTWSSWGSFGKCDKSCGTGSQSRTRSCVGRAFGGKACVGSTSNSAACNTHSCPVDCVVPAFGAWTTCTLSCGTGSQKRKRATVAPQFGGVACPHASETRTCMEQPCPIDGGWTDFTAWSSCSKKCDSGITFRTRTCTQPATMYGGVPCAGDKREQKACNTQVCNCPTCSLTNGLLTIAHSTVHNDGAAGAHGPRKIHANCQSNKIAVCAPTHVIAHTCRYNRDTKACACTCKKPNYTHGPGMVQAGHFRDHVVMKKNVSPLVKSSATTSAADVFISEVVEGGAYTKAVELFNPTTIDIKLDGITLQWHHNGKTFTAKKNLGYDMNLAGYTIGAGKTFVICRNQKPSEALKSGKCDITNASKGLNGQGKNAVAHNGDDAIELKYNGKVIDVIGKVGQKVTCWKDAKGKCLTKNVTIHRRASVRVGSATFRPIEWDLSKKDYVANLGIHM